ncbi:unnamed protein product, partial [Polarella glacialis]
MAEVEAAAAARPAEIRALVADAPLSEADPSFEFEGALRLLRQHWPVHCIGRRYAVELWDSSSRSLGHSHASSTSSSSQASRQKKASAPGQSLAGKQLVELVMHSRLGVSLSFPPD